MRITDLLGKWVLSAGMVMALPLTGLLCGSCSDDIPMVNIGVDDSYTVYRMQWLRLRSELGGSSCRWILHCSDGSDKVLSESERCMFISDREGVFDLSLELDDGANRLTHPFTVRVLREEIEYSPYLHRVYDYHPAPGQFVNMMPIWEKGDSYEDMLRKAEESISGTMEELVSLGAFGGYITFGFDHTVVNMPGKNDFMVLGNSFYEEGFESAKAGSCEPGIVMVSVDVNGNGLPDDEWFELAGSEFASPATIHDYAISYTRPDDLKPAVPRPPYILDAEYIAWTDSEGEAGFVAKNFQHTQSYYPMWETADELHFSGSRLAGNALDVYGNGLYFQLSSYPWGYVDNHPNIYGELNSFDIGNAVDSEGKPVWLPGIDFVRVYTAVNQYCNWIGETSTEIAGARDLHLLASE